MSRPRAETFTGTSAPARSAWSGEGWTTAGAGGGIRPGHGAGSASAGGGPALQVTKRARCAGLRPPPSRARTTPSAPRTRLHRGERAGRTGRGVARPSPEPGLGDRPVVTAHRGRRPDRPAQSVQLAAPSPGPRGGRRRRGHRNGRARGARGGRRTSPRVRMPSRASSSVSSGSPRTATGDRCEEAGGATRRDDRSRSRAASTAAKSPSATPTSTG